MEKKTLFSKIIEYIKTAAIFILFGTAVFLVSLYVSRTQSLTTDSEIPVNSLLILKDGGGAQLLNYKSEYIAPDFIGFGLRGVKKGTYVKSKFSTDLFKMSFKYICAAFGNGFECTTLTEKRAQELIAATAAGDFIFLSFPTALPTPFIYAFCSEKNSVSVSEVDAENTVFIKDMFIVGKDSGDFFVLGVGMDGVCRIYEKKADLDDAPDFDLEGLEAYNINAVFREFSFILEKNTDFLRSVSIYGLGILSDNREPFENVTCKAVELTAEENVSFFERAVRFFGFDSEKAYSYSDSVSVIWIDKSGTLKFAGDGEISYSADMKNSDFTVSSLLHYENYSGKYSIFEYLLASQNLAESFAAELGGIMCGEAELKISGINTHGNALTVEFAYYINNIPLFSSAGEHIRAFNISIEEGKVSSVTVLPVLFEKAKTTSVALPLLWSLRFIDRSTDVYTDVFPLFGYMPDSGEKYEIGYVLLGKKEPVNP